VRAVLLHPDDIPADIRHAALASLEPADQALIGPMSRLEKLMELHACRRAPKGEAQERFVEVAMGLAAAESEYERAYVCFLRIAEHLIERPKRLAEQKKQEREARAVKRVTRNSQPLQKPKPAKATAKDLQQVVRKSHEEKRRAERAVRDTAVREIRERNEADLRVEAKRQRKRDEELCLRTKVAVPVEGSPAWSRTTARPGSKFSDVDEFGLPYEPGVPRPGWRPLGRFQ
jgi:uncharacterized protein YifE (UPF0438 family)